MADLNVKEVNLNVQEVNLMVKEAAIILLDIFEKRSNLKSHSLSSWKDLPKVLLEF